MEFRITVPDDQVIFLEDAGVVVEDVFKQFTAGLVGKVIKERHEMRYKAIAELAGASLANASNLEASIDAAIAEKVTTYKVPTRTPGLKKPDVPPDPPVESGEVNK